MPGRDLPSDAESLALLDSLLNGWSSQSNDMRARRRNVYAGQFNTTYALAAHTHRVAEAAARLWREQLHVEAMPLIRAAFEHAVTSQFVAQCEDGVDGFFSAQARNQRVSLEQIARAGWDGAVKVTDGLAAWEGRGGPAADSARNFEKLCNDLTPGGEMLYATYRNLSALTHPSKSIVARYLDAGEETTIFMEPEPIGETAAAWYAYILCSTVAWAGRAFDMMLDDHPRRSELRRAAQQLAITLEFQISDAYRERQRRRQQDTSP